jgi:hypothetical protein
MTLRARQCRFTALLGQLITWATAQGYELAGKEWLRTPEQQRLYVQQGKSRTLHSKHLDGLAVDFALFLGGVYQTDSAAYQPLGTYWTSLDPACVWGGDWTRFPDGNHFEWGD